MNPREILIELWQAGILVRLAPDDVNLAVPAGRLTPGQREQLLTHKPALINFLAEGHATTVSLIAVAMNRCDQFNDSDQARAEMRQQCLELPPHLQRDLLAHFTSKRCC